MKKSLKLLVLSIITLFCISLVACGSSSSSSTGGGSNEGQQVAGSDSSATADDTVYQITYAGTVPDSHPVILSMNEVAEEMLEASNGRLVMTVYPNNQLGDSRANLEAMQDGTIQCGEVSTAPMSIFTNNYQPLSLPFFFKDYEQTLEWTKGDFAAALAEKTAEECGFFPLTFALSGARTLTNSTRTVSTPTDMAGLKIRVMENDIYIKAFEAMGAAATPMSYAEVFTGLQQKTIDGQDNPVIINVTNAYYEVQNYWTDLNHTIDVAPIVVSADWYYDLPEDLRVIFTDCMEKGADRIWEEVAENEAEARKVMEENCEVTYLTDEQRAVFKETCEPVYEWFATQYPDVNMDEFMASLN